MNGLLQISLKLLANDKGKTFAVKEVSFDLISYQKDHEALRSLGNIMLNMQDKYHLALAQYQSGLSDYANFINNKLNALQSETNYVNQRLIVITDVTQVYQTLGV